MANEELSDRLAREEVPPATGMRLLWDTQVKGFGLRITKAGARAWVLNYRSRGVQRSMTIGSYPDWNVRAAREQAKELKRRIDVGEDPMGDRHAERAAPTVADLVELYRRVHLPKKRLSGQTNDNLIIEKHVLPRIGKRKLVDIKHPDIATLHRKISETVPIAANRVVALLSKMFSIAVREEWIDRNPCRGVEKNAENRRERFLSPAEISRLVQVLDAHPERTSASAIKLLLLTGARRSEALGATWDQFDLDTGTWSKPAATTKQARLHRVPLSAPALDLLREIKAGQERDVADARKRGVVRPLGKHVFPGSAGQPLREVKRLWASVCKSTGIADARLHDLRHTYASILASSGLSLPIIGRMLGHTQSQTTMRYSHLADDPLRAAAEIAGKAIADARDPKMVVPLRNRLK